MAFGNLSTTSSGLFVLFQVNQTEDTVRLTETFTIRSNNQTPSTHEIELDLKTALIDDDVKQVLEIIIQITLFIITSLFGIVVNTINIVVYKKQGLKDSITLGFFALSISDLFIVTSLLMVSSCYIAKNMLPNHPIHFIGIHYVSTANLRQMAHSFSNVLTAFLSIERCCCVIFPFKVKSLFTRDRTLAFIIGLLVFHVACFAPLFATNQLRWMRTPARNNTYVLGVWFAPGRQAIESFIFTIVGIVIPTLSQIIVICSAVIMTYGLRSSSKLRKMITGKGNDEADSKSKSCLSSRETRLVKAMLFLGVIFTICNLPYLSLIYAMLFEPELNLGRIYHNIFSFFYSIYFLLSSVNASVNICVYYLLSAKYRQVFTETFVCNSCITPKQLD